MTGGIESEMRAGDSGGGGREGGYVGGGGESERGDSPERRGGGGKRFRGGWMGRRGTSLGKVRTESNTRAGNSGDWVVRKWVEAGVILGGRLQHVLWDIPGVYILL